MKDKKKKGEPDGAPLAVCVNDCQLDYGQPRSQLAPVCFRVGCAFAEMRWGTRTETSGEIILATLQPAFHLVSGKC